MPRKAIIIVTLSILSLFVILNVLFSQQIHPLYFSLINGDQKASVEFLKDIRFQPEYSSQLTYFSQVFGSDFKAKMMKEKTDREKNIAKYEEILKDNPASRDILLDLALLYYQDGNNIKALKTYQDAKTIDPAVYVKELEK